MKKITEILFTLILLFSCGKYDDSSVRSDIEGWNPGWWHWSSSAKCWTGTSRRCRRWFRRFWGGTAWWVWLTWVTGRDIQSRSLRGGRSPCATGRTKYGKDGADVKEFSQTIHHEVGGHEFVKLLGAILLFWKHSIMRFKTYFVCKGSITNWE